MLEGWPKDETLEVALAYASEHLDLGWSDRLRAPPYLWWKRHQQGNPHALWPLMRSPFPFDEVLAVEECELLSENPSVGHLERGICVLRRASIEFLDGEGTIQPFVIDRDQWGSMQIERIHWRPERDDGLRLTFPDGNTYEIGFDDVTPREKLFHHWRSLMNPADEREPEANTALPHPGYREEIDKVTLEFRILSQDLRLHGRPTLSACKASEMARLGEWRLLANQMWDRLPPQSQHCLAHILDTIWGPDSWDEEGEFEIDLGLGGYELFVSRELLESTLATALAELPPADLEWHSGRFCRSQKVLEMLQKQKYYCTQVCVSLRWGFG